MTGLGNQPTGIYSYGPQQPRKAPLSLIVLVVGTVAMAVALVLVIAGVPGSMFYDQQSGAKRTAPPSKFDMLGTTASIDANMKYIKQWTSHHPEAYNGRQNSINKSEDAIPPMAAQVEDLYGSVVAMEAGLAAMRDTTLGMKTDMEAMAKVSEKSAATERAMVVSVFGLGKAMGEMYAATQQLTQAMGEIEKKAGNIAENRTSVALKKTEELNGAMPDKVPVPVTSLKPDNLVAAGGMQ